MPDAKSRRWHQLHLSTLLAVTFVFGAGLFFMLQKHSHPLDFYGPPGEEQLERTTRGWPVPFYRFEKDSIGSGEWIVMAKEDWNYRALAFDLGVLLAICAATAALLEVIIRRRRESP